MIVYKYIPFEFGYQLIKNKRIKVSHPKDFIDPFELLPAVYEPTFEEIKSSLTTEYLKGIYNEAVSKGLYQGTFLSYAVSYINDNKKILNLTQDLPPALRKTINKLKDNAGESGLITCFSGTEPNTTDEEILMWAHYSLGHTGIRVAIEADLLELKERDLLAVKYSPDRLIFNPLDYFKYGTEAVDSFFRETLIAKSHVWKYENEHRWFLNPQKCIKEEGHDFIQINPRVIIGVDCGINCSEVNKNKIKELVRAIGINIPIKEVDLDPYKYKMRYK